MYHISVTVCQYLYFYMSEIFNVLFDIYSRVTKGSHCFLLGNINPFYQLCFIEGNTNTFPTTTSSCFNDDWVFNFIGKFNSFFDCINNPFGAWNNWYVGLSHGFTSNIFCTHFSNGFWCWPNEDDITITADNSANAAFSAKNP